VGVEHCQVSALLAPMLRSERPRAFTGSTRWVVLDVWVMLWVAPVGYLVTVGAPAGWTVPAGEMGGAYWAGGACSAYVIRSPAVAVAKPLQT
jgi:hypothetical protein